MKEENFVYVRLEYEEALQSKRDILASQADLLRITQMIRKYRLLRLEELKLKAQFSRKLKELKTKKKKIKTGLPPLKVPSIKKDEEETKLTKIIKSKKESYDDGLESQLREIQEKLKAIGG